MEKLLNFQKNSDLKEYKDQVPKKPLQDVVTRWWSTFRSIRRMRLLKKAVRSLMATGEISVTDLTDQEWLVLHQIEIVLEPMAEFQRILEGEQYVTVSLSILAVHQVRAAYMGTIACEHAEPAVKELAKLLLKDFDARYEPADEATGAVKYFRQDELGKYNRYKGLHQFVFFAGMLDPRVAPLLNNDIMTGDDYEMLKTDLVAAMVAQVKASKTANETEPPAAEEVPVTPQVTKKKSKFAARMNTMFGAMRNRNNIVAQDSDEVITNAIRAELDRYLFDASQGSCPLHTEDDQLNDPLKWWKENAARFPYVANAARRYLAIPATSAPSERVWSRSARLLALRRARLKDDLIERMMFVKENMRFVTKHYRSLRKEALEKKDHFLVDIEMQYLPSLEERFASLDIGQDDDKLEF
eukprot:scaffold244197_cov36-Cyclotella_meneghiniana.AAC.1